MISNFVAMGVDTTFKSGGGLMISACKSMRKFLPYCIQNLNIPIKIGNWLLEYLDLCAFLTMQLS